MKKIIFILIALTFSRVYSQDFEVINGQEYTVEPWTTFNEVFGSDENGIYVKRMIYKDMWGYGIQKIDKNTLKQVYYIEIADKWSHWGAGDNKDFLLYLNHNKIVLITYGDFELKFREYDCNTGKKLSEPKSFWKYGNTSVEKFEYRLKPVFSSDKSKFAIFNHRFIKKDNKITDSFYSVAVFDTKTLMKISEKDFPNSFKESNIGDLQYCIDNSGNVFLKFNYMSDFNNKAIGTAISKFDISNQQISTLKLNTEDKFLKNSGLKIENNSLCLSGLFLDTLHLNDMQKKKPGVYLILIDPQNMSIKNTTYSYFSNDVTNKLTYKRKYEFEGAQNKNLDFSELISINGSYYLIEIHTYDIMHKDFNSSSSVFDYTSLIDKELLISKFDNSGQLVWMNILPKSNSYNTYGYNYYIKGKDLLIFNQENSRNDINNIENYNGSTYFPTHDGEGCTFVCTTVNQDGKMSRKKVFIQDKKLWYLHCINILSKNGDGLLLRMQDGKKERYDYIKIK